MSYALAIPLVKKYTSGPHSILVCVWTVAYSAVYSWTSNQSVHDVGGSAAVLIVLPSCNRTPSFLRMANSGACSSHNVPMSKPSVAAKNAALRETSVTGRRASIVLMRGTWTSWKSSPYEAEHWVLIIAYSAPALFAANG